MKQWMGLVCVWAVVAGAWAQEAASPPERPVLTPRGGTVAIGSGLATATLTDRYRFLDAADARKVLEGVWGNPPDAEVLGMVVPAGFDPMSEAAWAVVVTYDEDGHVKDDDAEKIDYAKLLREMQEGTKESNAERVKRGYPAVELLGWAEPPHYDRGTHKLYWAKSLRFEGGTETTLNYSIRLLGRKGVLVLNAIASESQLATVQAATPDLLSMVDFNAGQRYADYNALTDKTAEYGIAALVAGGVAAKTGMLKGLWLALLSMKKFVVLAAVAVVAWVRKLIAGRKNPHTQD